MCCAVWCKWIMQSKVTCRRLARIHTTDHGLHDYRAMVCVQSLTHMHTHAHSVCVCSVRVWAFVCVLAKCEMLVSFALFPYTGHSGTSRTQPMHKLYEQSFSPFKAGGRTQSEATNMSRSDVTCYAILDNNFFCSFLHLLLDRNIDGTIKQRLRNSDDTMVIQVVISLFDTFITHNARVFLKRCIKCCCWSSFLHLHTTTTRTHESWSSIDFVAYGGCSTWKRPRNSAMDQCINNSGIADNWSNLMA